MKNILKWVSVLFITASLGITQEVGEIAVVPDDTTKDPGLKPGDLAPSWALMYAPGKFEFLKNWTVERDQNFTGAKLPRSEEVTFVLFVIEGVSICEGMRDSVEVILPDFLPIRLGQKTDQDEACYHHSIITFPTLDVVYKEQIVRRVEGYHPADQLRENLVDLFDD